MFATPYRETLFTGKATTNLNPAQYLSVRYGYNKNKQPYGVDALTPPNGWGDEHEQVQLHQREPQLGARRLEAERVHLPVRRLRNPSRPTAWIPYQLFPNGVHGRPEHQHAAGHAAEEVQFRDDFSWHMAGMGGLGHDFKAGVNFINEPRLFLTFNTGTGGYAYTHLDNNVNGPISPCRPERRIRGSQHPDEAVRRLIQDDWRVNDRLTLNLGLPLRPVTGMAIDQIEEPELRDSRQGRQGRRARRHRGVRGLRQVARRKTGTTSSRASASSTTSTATARTSSAAAGAVYYDFGYTNANILFAAVNATGVGAGTIFQVTNSNGIRNPDGSFFKVSDPITNIQGLNEAGGALPLNSHIASPRIKQPYSDQTSFGYSRQLDPSTAIDVDYVHTAARTSAGGPRSTSATATRRPAPLLDAAGAVRRVQPGELHDRHQQRPERATTA